MPIFLVNPCRFVVFVEMETEEEAREEGISEAVHAQMQAKWKELSKKRWESVLSFICDFISVRHCCSLGGLALLSQMVLVLHSLTHPQPF